jgi:hypothetical protein
LGHRKRVLIALLIIFFLSLATIISIITFQLGQHTGVTTKAEKDDLRPIAVASPTAALSTTPLPVIVTNTPTNTPTPTPTLGPTATPTPTPTDTPTPTPTPIVVITHINALGRLETTEFAMHTVVDLEKDPSNLWEQIVGSDKLLLVAEGEVVAGFDLDKVSRQDIIVQGTTVKIILPSPEIFYSRIDNERTYVYERKTGLLVKPDQTLESRARLLAEQSLVDWAIERGIYEKAESYGRLQIENLLRSLGFTQITIEVSESEL